MDTQIGIWHIKNAHPIRLHRSRVALEKHLEDWIEADTTMIGQGIRIVGRQVHCDGGFIDLLAIDLYTNSWIIVEIKRGDVRRKTVTQAIDYAASIDLMSADELREKVDTYLRSRGSSLQAYLDEKLILDEMFSEKRDIRIVVAGTGRDADLGRIIDYLVDKHDMHITVVEFDVFEGENGEQSLVRQLTEQDTAPTQQQTPQQIDDAYERLFKLADTNGIGDAFRLVYETCTKHDLYPRPYKWSIMYTPPQHKGRCAVVAWVTPAYGKLQAYAIPEAFAEFYTIDENEATAMLGDGERNLLSFDEAQDFVARIDQTFEIIATNAQEQDGE